MNKLYEQLIEDYKDNKEILKEINNLYKYDPYFTNFEVDFFTEDLIKTYGMKAICNALEYGKEKVLLTSEDKEFAKYFFTYMPNLSTCLFSNYITIEDLKIIRPYVNNINFREYLSNFKNTKELLKFKKLFHTKKALETFEIISKNYKITNTIDNYFYDLLFDKDFQKFCKNLDYKQFYKIKYFKYFIKRYKEIKEEAKNVKTEQDINMLNNFLFNAIPQIKSFNLKTYNQERKDLLINNDDLYEAKELLSTLYFGEKLDKTMQILADAKKILEKENLNTNKIDYLLKLKFLPSKEELIKYIEVIKDEVNLAYKIIDKTKFIAKHQLKNELTNFNIIKKPEIITLDGENFMLLAHRVTGLDDVSLASQLIENPKIWTRNYEEEGYISTSVINNNHLAQVIGNGYTLGFNNLLDSDILLMGPEDIYTVKKNIRNKTDNSYTRYMTPEELIKNTYSEYNEVVLRRYREKKPILPDCVISIDDIENIDREVSSDFNIPLVNIKSPNYIENLIQRYHYYLEKRNPVEALLCLKYLVVGFNNTNYGRDKYINRQTFQKLINKVFEKANEETNLKELFHIFNNLVEFIEKYLTYDLCIEFEEIKEKVKK